MPNKSFYKEGDYEIVHTMIAKDHGRCCLDEEHKIKRGDKIGKLQHSNNPFVPIPGWACKKCIEWLPRAVQ